MPCLGSGASVSPEACTVRKNMSTKDELRTTEKNGKSALEQTQLNQIKELLEQSSVEPVEISESCEMFVRDLSDISDRTASEYSSKCDWFLEFCQEHDIKTTAEINAQVVKKYKYWRKHESSDCVDELATKTMRDEMLLVRQFIRFLEQINAVKSTFSDGIKIPELGIDEGVRRYEFPANRAKNVLSYLRKYEYASHEHVVCLLVLKTGRRPGCLYSLDVDDVVLDADRPYISFKHNEETQLKNDGKSESEVNIYSETVEALRDYLANVRHDITEDGRRPLLTSKEGRLTKSTMRKYMYKYTRPCAVNNSCPHDRDPTECTAATNIDQASKCPSSVPPYAGRHGHITELRRQGVDIDKISERCDVSPAVIKQHYDERTKSEKRQHRRDSLDAARSGSEGGYL